MTRCGGGGGDNSMLTGRLSHGGGHPRYEGVDEDDSGDEAPQVVEGLRGPHTSPRGRVMCGGKASRPIMCEGERVTAPRKAGVSVRLSPPHTRLRLMNEVTVKYLSAITSE